MKIVINLQTRVIICLALWLCGGLCLAQTGVVSKTDPLFIVTPEERAEQQPVDNETLPPVLFTEMTRDWEFIRLRRVPLNVRIRVVDAADGQPIEGFPLWVPKRETMRSDSEGVINSPNHELTLGIPAYISAWSLSPGRSAAVPLRKNGEVVDARSLVLPTLWRGPVITAEMEGTSLEGEFRLNFSGVHHRVSALLDKSVFEHKEGVMRVDEASLRYAKVHVETSDWNALHEFAVDVRKEFSVGPVEATADEAFLAIAGQHFPFRLSEEKPVSVTWEPVVGKAYITVRNAMHAYKKLLYPGSLRFMDGISLIRVTDTYVAAHSNTGGGRPMSTWRLVPRGKYAVVLGEFNAGALHMTFIHAIREGIDLAALGVPVVDISEETPEAYVVLDGKDFPDIYRRVEQALQHKRAADAAAKTPPAP